LLKYLQDRPIFSRLVNQSALVIGDATFFDRPKLGERALSARCNRHQAVARDGVEKAESW
jgi:hypothetical protein